MHNQNTTLQYHQSCYIGRGWVVEVGAVVVVGGGIEGGSVVVVGGSAVVRW